MTDSWTWITIPGETPEQPLLEVAMSFIVDPLSLLLVTVTVFISILIAMTNELTQNKTRFLFYSSLTLLLFATVALLLSGNFIQLFLFWQLSTFAAAMLILCHSKDANSEKQTATAHKFLLVNWIADVPFLIGICLIWMNFETLEFSEVFSQPLLDKVQLQSSTVISGICFCLFAAVMGRCAQAPFYIWIFQPGSTSSHATALIHSAAFLPTGVYLLVRCTPLFELAPDIQLLIMVIGGLTALLTAIIALAATDATELLSFCSASLFGFIFVGIGSGADVGYSASLLLLLTNSTAMTFLFLTADTNRAKRFPSSIRWELTMTSLLLITGLCGQNAILGAIWEQQPAGTGLQSSLSHLMVWPILLSMLFLSIALSRHIFRSILPPQGRQTNSQTSTETLPSTVRFPLHILFLLAFSMGPVFGGIPFINSTPLINNIHSQSSPTSSEPIVVNLFTTGIGSLAALLGVVLAWMLYRNSEMTHQTERLSQTLAPFHRLGKNRFYVDNFSHLFLEIPLNFLSRLIHWLDWFFLDVTCWKSINRIPTVFASIISPLQNSSVQFYALSTMLTAAVLLFVFLWMKV